MGRYMATFFDTLTQANSIWVLIESKFVELDVEFDAPSLDSSSSVIYLSAGNTSFGTARDSLATTFSWVVGTIA
jgi:hypothetical protein